MSVTQSLEADRAAGAPASDADDGSLNQYVTFDVAGEMFAVHMAPVQEIIRVPDVARLPLAPAVLDGLANLRGRVLPIINLRRLFGCDDRDHDDATRALVINLGQPLGFVVDRVASVIGVEPGEIESADSIQSIVAADYLTGVIQRPRADGGRDLLLTLDFQKLIDSQFSATALGASHTGSRHPGGASDPAAMAEAVGEADGDELRLVSFSVAGQEYALDIADVQEIVQLPERVTEMPNVPPHVLGLISLRQRLLPLVSLRRLFALPAVASSEQHRIVVVALPNGRHVGLVTDAVKEVLSVPRSQAEAMPSLLAGEASLQEFSSICRLDGGKRLVSIIATDRLLGLGGIRDALEAAHRARAQTTDVAEEIAMGESSGREGAADDDDTQVVIFRLGAEEFGVPIMSVQEIVRVPETLTRVPKTPHFVEGVINLRGTVLPVIDQRARLGLDTIERNDRQRIMVYLLGGVRTGFIVDSVAEVLRIPRTQVAAAPELSDEQSRLISKVAKLDGDRRLVMLIDPAWLLGSREVQAIEAMTGSPAGPVATEAAAAPSADLLARAA